MIWPVVTTKQFDKDVDKLRKNGYDLSLLESIVTGFMSEKSLSSQVKDHSLKGDLKGLREYHIEYDWTYLPQRKTASHIDSPVH